MRASFFLVLLAAVAGCSGASGSRITGEPSTESDPTSPAGGESEGSAEEGRSCTKTRCSGGGSLSLCLTRLAGQCVKAEYTTGGKTFACASCEDCAAAAEEATAVCVEGGTSSSSGSTSGGSSSGSSSGGSSSGGSSSGGSSSGGSSSGGTPSTTCTPVNASCVGGGQMSYCITYGGAGGACSNITYKYGSKSFSCNGCTSCNDAYYDAYTECQDAVGACDDLAGCCATIQSAYKSSCTSSLNSYRSSAAGDVSCKSLLASYKQQGLCF